MRKTIACALTLFSLFFLSCSTTKQNFYSPNNSNISACKIDTDSIAVSVDIDYINSADIANQITQLLFSNFSSYNAAYSSVINSSEKLSAEVKITQRSFMRNIDQYNSIFVCYTLYDASHSIILQNCITKETKNTIISGIEQNKIVSLINENVQKYLLQNVERKNLKKTSKENVK